MFQGKIEVWTHTHVYCDSCQHGFIREHFKRLPKDDLGLSEKRTFALLDRCVISVVACGFTLPLRFMIQNDRGISLRECKCDDSETAACENCQDKK